MNSFKDSFAYISQWKLETDEIHWDINEKRLNTIHVVSNETLILFSSLIKSQPGSQQNIEISDQVEIGEKIHHAVNMSLLGRKFQLSCATLVLYAVKLKGNSEVLVYKFKSEKFVD